MRTERVIVEPYNEAWEQAFDKIKNEIEAAIGDLILGVEHVGSTSVEGMWAKPCIDIDVIIKDYSVFDAVVNKLAAIGYIHEGDLGIPGREAFRYTDKPHLYPHHLYVCPAGSQELYRHLTFRDFLRTHPAAAQEYGRVKERAALQHPDDIEGYIRAKTPVIEKLYAQCGLL